MTEAEIKKRSKEIEGKRDDPEVAHDLEDLLYSDFIYYVAQTSTSSLQRKARLILQTQEIQFPRWTA